MAERAGSSVDAIAAKGKPVDAMAKAESRRSSARVELLVAELRHRTAELERANRELRRVSHYRSLFLAQMSHELRTPLTSILGFTEILLDQEVLTEVQRRFCQKVRESGLQLQASLNQLVDLSRTEGGQTELFLQEFSLRETVREACAAVARMAHKRGVKVEYELAPEVSTVVSDKGKLRQVLFNFIAWAVSRSHADDVVKISVGLDGPRLWIKVLDRGESLKEADNVLDPEAEPFLGEPNLNELGVIICRRLLQAMDGSVTGQNREERGLEVRIELPARPLRG